MGVRLWQGGLKSHRAAHAAGRTALEDFLNGLAMLDIGHNHFGTVGLDALLERKPKALHTLNLRDNDLSDEGAELFIPPLAFCTDNAAMAAVAVEKWRRRQFASLDLDAVPAWTPTVPT